MWSSLPSNLRTVLGTALVLGIGVAAAAFTLSFFALKEAAENPELKFGAGHAWLFPIGVDMALLFFEVLLIAASMVRVQEHGHVVQYPRAIPFLLVVIAAAGTLYFNATRVPKEVRPIALAVPAASILVTLGLAYLLKMLGAVSGAEVAHVAPPASEPNRIVRKSDVLQGEIVRGPDASGPAVASEQAPRSRTSVTPQSGQSAEAIESGDGVKRALMRSYLASLDPRESGRVTGSSIKAAMKAMHVNVSEREARRVLDEWKATRNGSA
jgi:Protein of unknown function (DUF2637)